MQRPNAYIRFALADTAGFVLDHEGRQVVRVSNTQQEGRANESFPKLQLVGRAATFILVFLLGYMLAGKLTDVERLDIEHKALGRAWIYLKIRPGLSEQLSAVRKDLDDIAQSAKFLADERASVSQDSTEAKARLGKILTQLEEDRKALVLLQARYGLSPQETAFLGTLGDSKAEHTETADNKASAKNDK
jgi:hypothetical protein